MINSLKGEAVHLEVTADVVLVGAGLVGLFLGNYLSSRGLRVVVVESGPRGNLPDSHPLNDVEMVFDDYSGSSRGRFRGLGGTSSRWGGALLPSVDADFGPHPCGFHDGWGLDSSDFSPFLEEIEDVFGVSPGSYFTARNINSDCVPDGFISRFPKWPKFNRRNSALLFSKKIANEPKFQIWTDATVTKINLLGGRVYGVTAKSVSGAVLSAIAGKVIISAGAIESTRLLLLLNRAEQGRVFSPGSPLGKGFHDHLSSSIADIEVTNRRYFEELFGFRFCRGGMRNLRFELAHETRISNKFPAAFLHVAFHRDDDDAFSAVRRVFQSAQKGQSPSLKDVRGVIGGVPWLAKAAVHRVLRGKVLPPEGTLYQLHLVTEQKPTTSQTISLSDRASDIFGMPIARIAWKVLPHDTSYFRRLSDFSVKSWNSGSLARVSIAVPRDFSSIEADLVSGGGIYHPAGTTPIGRNAECGVVDENLMVHGVIGLYVVSSSVFPSIGGSSPSLTLLQLALRLGRNVLADFNR